MHPAYSVIVFTTASGAGYGLLFWLSLAEIAGALPHGSWAPFAGIAVALTLITAGLLSSTLHLGHPERAIHAFSQWRSSWLSREGVISVATFAPSGLMALLWLAGIETGGTIVLAALSAIGAGITVYCTGMIYASLRTIRQWNLGLVPIVYLGLAAATGALLLATLLAAFGETSVWIGIVTAPTLAAALAVKLLYFTRIDADPGRYTDAMALGFGEGATIRQLDPPHTRPNFVMREMGYQVGRRHASRLRKIALAALFGVPLALVILALMMTGFEVIFYGLAVVSTTVGLLVERWLFFAEAEHVSMLYYGKSRA